MWSCGLSFCLHKSETILDLKCSFPFCIPSLRVCWIAKTLTFSTAVQMLLVVTCTSLHWVDDVNSATAMRFKSWRFKRKPFVRANRGIVCCVWFIYRKMELRYWLVSGNMKNNWVNVVEWKAFVNTVRIKSADLKNKFLF